MEVKYFSVGSESEAEGLTLATRLYQNGKMIGGPTALYKAKEITKEEYDAYQARFNEPEPMLGMVGLVNEIGAQKAAEMMEELERQNLELRIKHYDKEISLVTRKIKRQLELGIITEEDVDTEIGLNAEMSEFAEEIKRRLQEG